MLSLARVMVNPPKLLVADELSLGLAPIVIDEVYRNLATIRDAGTAILLVEQYVGHALGLADDVVVLQHGAVAHAGPATIAGRHRELPHLTRAGAASVRDLTRASYHAGAVPGGPQQGARWHALEHGSNRRWCRRW